ncbi:efflux RND transporter periplasmic adaptor subunit [Hydrocarboniphaga sp.]|uniref:efflux RND transporter periplasmic adaptor subunit n=1 Tax=Hydrocarboniphaga sp. TaxID=2033016 RepID=UPI003D12127B
MFAAVSSSAFSAPPSLQIDKQLQHQLAITTQQPQLQTRVKLSARVLADPRRRWRAMSDQPGVLEAPAGGFPVAGQSVSAGQVLAWIRPSYTDPERRDLLAERRAQQRDFDLAQVQVRRFDIDTEKQIDISLPTPSMAIVADYHGSQARGEVLDRALSDRIALKAPAAGVLLASFAQSRQQAAPGDALFEGAAADGLVIELVHDDRQPLLLDGAQLGAAKLKLIGDSYDAALRAWRALYSVDADAVASLTPGQMLAIDVPLKTAQLRLPKSSAFLDRNESQVWVHEAAERFVPRTVKLAAADERSLIVTDGIGEQDRVVVDAASLLRLR